MDLLKAHRESASPPVCLLSPPSPFSATCSFSCAHANQSGQFLIESHPKATKHWPELRLPAGLHIGQQSCTPAPKSQHVCMLALLQVTRMLPRRNTGAQHVDHHRWLPTHLGNIGHSPMLHVELSLLCSMQPFSLISSSTRHSSCAAVCLQAPTAPPGSQATYVRKETQYAWDCIQKECQKVLTMLLQGQAPGAAAGAESKGE